MSTRTPIEDADKLRVESAARPHLDRGGAEGRLQVRPAMAHLGVMFGQAAEKGLSLEVATDMVVGIADNWADGGDARPVDVPTIPNDEILAGVNDPRVVATVPSSDWGGLFDLGCQYGQRRQIGQTHTQALYETGEWLRAWYRNVDGSPVDNPWPAPLRPRHPDPLAGQIGVNDGAFVCATGPRNIAGLHVGNLIGHGLIHGLDSILADLDLAAALGYHELRAWFQLKTQPGGWWDRWSTPRWNPADARELFLQILAAGAERGLKWHLAGGGIRDMSDGEEDAAFGVLNWAIRQLGPEPFSLVEACNEIRDTGDVDDIEPSELMRLIRIATDGFPQILTALSAYTGTEDREILTRYTPSSMAFYIVHGSRAFRMNDKLRHMYSLAGEGTPVRRNMKQSESFGPGRLVSASDNAHEINAHTMTLAAAQCALARGAWTFMSGPGVVKESEPLASMPGLAETPAILRALPQDLAQFQVLAHGGDRFRGTRIWAALDEWRSDVAIHHDGRFVSHRYGPPENHRPDDLRQERAISESETLADGPWGRVVSGRLQ